MTPVPAHVGKFAAVSAVSGHLDTRTAATEVAAQLHDELIKIAGAERADAHLCDACLIFGSFHHRTAFADACESIRTTLNPRALLGVTAEAVLGADAELEGVAGLSVIAMRLPGVKLTPWYSTPDEPLPLNNPAAIRERLGIDDTFKFTTLIGDPFTTPITKLLPAITSCQSDTNNANRPITVIGGMASGASQPGLNVMVLNRAALHAGAIGLSFSGDFDADFIVSQGCKPIGKPFVITKSHEYVVLQLGGRRAMDVLQETAQQLDEADRALLSRGVLVGQVVNEYKPRFGRGDFLVRNIMGFDQRTGGIVVGPGIKTGQSIQFHVRDADTAREDLELLLDAQRLGEKPFAGLLFTCNGRGTKLFSQPNQDVETIANALPAMPLAGFFAAGEFGPMGAKSHLHGHTASLVILRERD
ncbi:MAG TPA: FIST C-terminal domain-containing protein [Phycisphaerales bacterium]|nr:FIST C-terminal domain-containing protein [Phycisphaerales bacterium]